VLIQNYDKIVTFVTFSVGSERCRDISLSANADRCKPVDSVTSLV